MFKVNNKRQNNVNEVVLVFLLLTLKKKIWPLFMDGVQLPQGYRATTTKQFTFYHLVHRNFWYSFDRPRKEEKAESTLEPPSSFEHRTLDWESSTLTTRPYFTPFSSVPFDDLQQLNDRWVPTMFSTHICKCLPQTDI